MAKLTNPVNEKDHTLGPDDAPLTLLEYGDFECPNCKDAYPVINEVIRKMGDQLRFAWRNFPLTQIHPYAEEAAEAAEAAGAQGKFWEMHDYLFEHQDHLNTEHLPQFAQAIGLNGNQFQQDLATHRFADNVHEDVMSGVRSGVNGTPTLFINGERYEGFVQVDELMKALRQAKEETQV